MDHSSLWQTIDPRRLWRRAETRLGAILLVFGGLSWGFLELADEVGEQETTGFDSAVLRFFRRHGHPDRLIGPDWLETVARELTALGSYPVIALLTLIIVGYLLLSRRFSRAVEVVLATAGGAMLGVWLKHIYLRERPSVVPRLVEVSTPSFPSGHSNIAAVVYLTLGMLVARTAQTRRQRVYAVGVAAMVALVVGWTRVALGVHYPTDVLAGWTVGLGWALGSWLAVNTAEQWLSNRRDDTSTSDDTSASDDTGQAETT